MSTIQMNTPAGWYADPGGQHQYRYWDGTQWTPMVSDNAVTATDPLRSPPPPPASQFPPATPPRSAPGVDPRIAGTVAEYAKRQYKVLAVDGCTVTMERPRNRFNWLLTVMGIIVTAGVVAALYVTYWAIWGVHRDYRVTITLGSQGEVEEIGDVLASYDRDRLQAHRRRCVGYGLVIAVIAISGLIGMVGNVASGSSTDPLGTTLGGAGLLVVLGGTAFIPFHLARKAARQLGLASEWWRFGM